MFEVRADFDETPSQESYSLTPSEVQEEFKRKLTTTEEVANMVKSGMWVSFSSGREARTSGGDHSSGTLQPKNFNHREHRDQRDIIEKQYNTCITT